MADQTPVTMDDEGEKAASKKTTPRATKARNAKEAEETPANERKVPKRKGKEIRYAGTGRTPVYVKVN